MGVHDLDTGEFLAVHYPDTPKELLACLNERIRFAKTDETSNGDFEMITRFKAWQFKFLDMIGRYYPRH